MTGGDYVLAFRAVQVGAGVGDDAIRAIHAAAFAPVADDGVKGHAARAFGEDVEHGILRREAPNAIREPVLPKALQELHAHGIRERIRKEPGEIRREPQQRRAQAADPHLRDQAAPVRGANIDHAVDGGIWVKDEALAHDAILWQVLVHFIRERTECRIPEAIAGFHHLQARNEAAHAVADQRDRLSRARVAQRSGERLAQLPAGVQDGIPGRVVEEPELIVLPDLRARAQLVEHLLPRVRAGLQAVDDTTTRLSRWYGSVKSNWRSICRLPGNNMLCIPSRKRFTCG